MHAASPKVIRSYRLVFRRRWRIFRIQGWRIPLPGGIELRLLGYWLAALGAIALCTRLPLAGAALAAVPPSLRLLAAPLAIAWLLSRWEVDGRPPHRALLGLLGWALRPSYLAAGRRAPPPGTELAPLAKLLLGPDLSAPRYPVGRLSGPARVLLRYPVTVSSRRGGRGRASKLWRLRATGAEPLHAGKVLEIPAGRTVVFEAERS